MWPYKKEAFSNMNDIGDELPMCDISSKVCIQTTPNRGARSLTEFDFRVPSCADCPICREQQELIEGFPNAVKGNGYRDIRCIRWEKRPGIYGACDNIFELSSGRPLDANGNTPQGCADCFRDIRYRQQQLPASS